ncbi:hypothetical protein DSLASN_33230 [Desulfoluna limicola]|uniref:Uncharacterized protein n=1 Tax=Desulfoluna limicola TaxID=2810562 RepID=A0ABM7PKQ5_9BACT|nr:hypothetical protein DSLASN_33230 [Desulfoluna limicola]
MLTRVAHEIASGGTDLDNSSNGQRHWQAESSGRHAYSELNNCDFLSLDVIYFIDISRAIDYR